MREVHVVVPDGVDDPADPSGGNVYDRRVCRGLADLGWAVREDVVAREPRPGATGARGRVEDPASALAQVLARVPAGRVVLVDGLVGSDRPEVLRPESGRLRLVVLVHLPRGVGGSTGVRRRESAALREVAGVVATSRWSRRWLLDTYGLDPARVAVATPGVDLADVGGGSRAGNRLLCVGALVPAKGQDDLVEALADLVREDWCCDLVGPLQRDPEFADRVSRRARERGIGHRVRLLGPLTGAALDAAYARADLLVTASRRETYGMVLTEALARGIPVVATRVGGQPEALGWVPGQGRPGVPGQQRPGILVPVDDPAALGGALGRWLADGALRRRLRQAALARRGTLRPWSATTDDVARALSAAACA